MSVKSRITRPQDISLFTIIIGLSLMIASMGATVRIEDKAFGLILVLLSFCALIVMCWRDAQMVALYDYFCPGRHTAASSESLPAEAMPIEHLKSRLRSTNISADERIRIMGYMNKHYPGWYR